MKEENFLNHVKEAIKLIEKIPEEYRLASFPVALAYILENKGPISEKKFSQKPKVEKHADNILMSEFDWSSTNISDLRPYLQNLTILRIAKEKFEIKTITAQDIQSILSQKFRIPKTPNAISMSLMEGVGKHVSRTQDKKKFYYEITINGIAYLELELKKLEKKNER